MPGYLLRYRDGEVIEAEDCGFALETIYEGNRLLASVSRVHDKHSSVEIWNSSMGFLRRRMIPAEIRAKATLDTRASRNRS